MKNSLIRFSNGSFYSLAVAMIFKFKSHTLLNISMNLLYYHNEINALEIAINCDFICFFRVFFRFFLFFRLFQILSVFFQILSIFFKFYLLFPIFSHKMLLIWTKKEQFFRRNIFYEKNCFQKKTNFFWKKIFLSKKNFFRKKRMEKSAQTSEYISWNETFENFNNVLFIFGVVFGVFSVDIIGKQT